MRFKVKDHYFQKAKKDQFLARSVYKLEEIDQKFRIINSGMKILDLGYYPGSWTQYMAKKVGPNGRIKGVDIQSQDSRTFADNVELFQKDAFELQSPEELNLEGMFHGVCSDMAPNTTGIKSVDQLRSLELVEKIFEILPVVLKKSGFLVVKVFESGEAQKFLKEQKKLFKSWNTLRPKSTRSCSKEYFIIGRGYLQK